MAPEAKGLGIGLRTPRGPDHRGDWIFNEQQEINLRSVMFGRR